MRFTDRLTTASVIFIKAPGGSKMSNTNRIGAQYNADIEADFDILAADVEIVRKISEAIDEEVPDPDRRARLKDLLRQ